LNSGQGVQVGQKVVALVLFLQLQKLTDGSEKVPDMQIAGWLDAGQNSHGPSSTADDSKWRKTRPVAAPAGHLIRIQ
jgi:hypothetical protein